MEHLLTRIRLSFGSIDAASSKSTGRCSTNSTRKGQFRSHGTALSTVALTSTDATDKDAQTLTCLNSRSVATHKTQLASKCRTTVLHSKETKPDNLRVTLENLTEVQMNITHVALNHAQPLLPDDADAEQRFVQALEALHALEKYQSAKRTEATLRLVSGCHVFLNERKSDRQVLATRLKSTLRDPLLSQQKQQKKWVSWDDKSSPQSDCLGHVPNSRPALSLGL